MQISYFYDDLHRLASIHEQTAVYTIEYGTDNRVSRYLVNYTPTEMDTVLFTYPSSNMVLANIYVTGDTLLLQIALNNLIENAVKYSGEDDIINI